MSHAVVLDQLARTSVTRGAPALGDRLVLLDRWIRDDLATLERDMAAIPRGTRAVHAAAAERVTVISGFGKLMRSPTARLENGPSSIPRHHA